MVAVPDPGRMDLAGVFVPLITPFEASGAVASAALDGLARQVLDEGASGIVALGTTAEPASLNATEQRSVLDTLGAVCRERSAPMIVGASTADALRQLAGRPEVCAALTLVPPFLRPGEDAVVAHFEALAAASPVPLVAYHVPYRTGQPLSADALRRIAALENVVGIKHAVGGIDADTVDFMADHPSQFAVLGGDDPFISPLLALGAQGGILASAHLATASFAALVDAWRAGDAARARALGHRLAPLCAALFAEPNPTVIKAALHAQGRIPTPDVRPPLLPAAPASRAAALRCCQSFMQG
jgi:4-hydroxy-tetrahydrodipicolinate synthase